MWDYEAGVKDNREHFIVDCHYQIHENKLQPKSLFHFDKLRTNQK